MIPVAFAYGGWQTASFVAGEMRDPRRDLSRGLFMGVAGVVVFYLAVNFVCLKVLGPAGLAATPTPATAVMRAALGERGAQWIAIGIAISTLGFLSQGILTRPACTTPWRVTACSSNAWDASRRVPGAGYGHCTARRIRRGDRADGKVRADSELRNLGGLHLIRAHGGVAIRVSRARGRQERAGDLSNTRTSLHHGAIRTRVRGDCGKHVGGIGA